MFATMEYVDILDCSEKLAKIITQSDVVKAYEQARIAMNEDKQAQKYIYDFNKLKDDYDDIQRFGRYHPDYNEIMKKVRAAKRAMDMHDSIASFKIAERHLQTLLDDVSELIAGSASANIKAPRDGAALTDSGCGCGSGGKCGCAS
ncbi:Regulatory protein YlbF [Lentibacillus sp. JNUCC-1]|uniref:YlbF family regulator n=1 Tax=Lentibacillus sp. JNUCC-1 TaxID=2654513 RepID=UPI0012E7AE6B|nr:YlbF family regulator [Lentibacillus sp. JNUCC-1]MUV36243.1 Regulatory protein YlbF [Lentibacillus sp. JNUCC-1]